MHQAHRTKAQLGVEGQAHRARKQGDGGPSAGSLVHPPPDQQGGRSPAAVVGMGGEDHEVELLIAVSGVKPRCLGLVQLLSELEHPRRVCVESLRVVRWALDSYSRR